MKTRFMIFAMSVFVFLISASARLHADVRCVSDPGLMNDADFKLIIQNLTQSFLKLDADGAKQIVRLTPERYGCAVTELVIALYQRPVPIMDLDSAQIEKIRSFAAAYEFFGERYTNPREDYDARLSLSVEHRYLNIIAQVLNVLFYERGQKEQVDHLLHVTIDLDTIARAEIPIAIVSTTEGDISRYVLIHLGDELRNKQLPYNVRVASFEGLISLRRSLQESVRTHARKVLKTITDEEFAYLNGR